MKSAALIIAFLFSFAPVKAQNSLIPESGIDFSGTFMKPHNVDNCNFYGLKGAYEKNLSTTQTWGVFAEWKIATQTFDNGSEFAGQKVDYSLVSIGGEYLYYFSSERNVFFGGEFFYASISSSEDYNGKHYSSSTDGFGVAPKIGFGGYTSSSGYLYISLKYNAITFDSDFEGPGVEIGFIFSLN